jgi:hypothetical protein
METDNIKVLRRTVKENVWKPITLASAVRDLEGGGYWKEGTTSEMLQLNLQLWTPFAQFWIPREGQTLEGLSDNIEEQLRLEIRRHLNKCDSEATPRICDRIKTSDGYRDIEDSVIRVMIHDDITPGAAIAQLEMEYE